MTSFSDLIAAISPEGETIIPEDWRQGRTTYGGLSAALCVAGALRAVEGLPPLRVAHFAFIGPAAGALRIAATVLRRGKSSVFVGVDLVGRWGWRRARRCRSGRHERAF
jgi:acyl-CoA thioesterase